ncbi:hypothetical protein VX159_09575 [Dechloromonas sp. ZY10]|uniref:hypothetical protein n=1 Tax=Dechloromonas aquae TaxID=2664436 RepID=UPI0035285A50
MRRKEGARAAQRLAVLAMFAGVLLNFPMLSVLPPVAESAGAGWFYLFAVWAGVIALAALSGRRGRG